MIWLIELIQTIANVGRFVIKNGKDREIDKTGKKKEKKNEKGKRVFFLCGSHYLV